MKSIKNLFAIMALLSFFISCNDTWDSHYKDQDDVIDNDDITSVLTTVGEYIKSEASMSTMQTLFDNTKVTESLADDGKLFTLLVVENNDIASSVDLNDAYIAQAHISDIAISPVNLINGEKVLMQNSKYLSVFKVIEEGNTVSYYFNKSKVKKIIKATDGYIYVLDSLVDTPKSLNEVIENLTDDYSMFRDMILSRNERVFDKNASIPTGVDETGSTVYDSVFVITNPYFNAQDFDLTSEALNATLLIPSNDVVKEAISAAKKNLATWEMQRADSILENWVFQAAFFNKEYSKTDFESNIDLKSVFNKQWRTTVQQVDLDNPIEMSNGVAYHVNWMKIPTNVLIYRIKDHFKWYEFLSEGDKNKFYQMENAVFDKCDTKVTAWSGWPAAGFPYIENRILQLKLVDTNIKESTMTFTPFKFEQNTDGTYKAKAYIIPEGEYDMCFGFVASIKLAMDIYYFDEKIRTLTQSDLVATTWHYDRGGQGYPEGYDDKKAVASPGGKVGNYDRDGGKAGVITVEGGAKELQYTFKTYNMATNNPQFHHWCLKPTANCY